MIANALGMSVRELCRVHGLTRCVLYLAIGGAPWARRHAARQLGDELAAAILGDVDESKETARR
jgi:hypothetical protein